MNELRILFTLLSFSRCNTVEHNLAGTFVRPPFWIFVAMYLLQRLAGLPDRGKDEVGGDVGKGPNGLAYGFSMVQGRRPYMEDVVYASLNFGSDGNSSFYGVFDGHSGKRAALWAKEHLPKNLTSELEASRGIQEALTRAFLRTDGDFLDKAGREGLTDGCTVSTALLCGQELYVANAGDRCTFTLDAECCRRRTSPFDHHRRRRRRRICAAERSSAGARRRFPCRSTTSRTGPRSASASSRSRRGGRVACSVLTRFSSRSECFDSLNRRVACSVLIRFDSRCKCFILF